MQSVSPKNPEEDEIQHLLKNVPACIRCRQNHRRCDPSLPWCRNCVKAGHTECVYFDPIIGEQVERSRIMALATRLRELRAANGDSPSSSRASAARPSRINPRGLYFGRRACISDSLLVPVPQSGESTAAPVLSTLLPELYNTAPPSADLQSFLVHNYRTNLHVLYPIFDDGELFLGSHEGNYKTGLTPVEQFRLNMIYSTSCLCVPGHRQSQSLLPLAKTFHRKAMDHVEGATSDVSIAVLRNFTIMALNSLFAPDQGNLNQLVGLASRMCVDLGVPRSEGRSLRRLFLAILCIERQVALTLDRPLFIPKPNDERVTDGSDPVEIFWSLLSIQCSSHRELGDRGRDENALGEKLHAVACLLENVESPAPSLLSALRETELLFAEQWRGEDSVTCRTAASEVLFAHGGLSFRTCLSPHWTFRACNVFLRNCPTSLVGRASNEMQMALLLLDRDAARWPNCKYLLDQLRSI